MKMMMRTVKATLAFVLLGSAVFAQSLGDAQKAIDAEQYQKAKGILKSLIASKPSEPEAYFYLGNLYLQDDYVDSAKITFNKGVAVDGEYALNYVGLGALDLESNNKAAAKANFEKAQSLVKKKDNGPALYTGKAYTWATKPDYDAALHYLENPANPKAAKVINPKDPLVFIAIGDAYRGRNNAANNDLSLAYQNYQAALGLDNSLIRPKLELAIIGKRAFAWATAVEEFGAIIKANPNYAPAYRELAETYRYWAYAEPKLFDENMKLGLQNYDKYMSLTDQSLESRLRRADFLMYAKEWKLLQQEAAEMAKISGTNDRILRYQGIAAFENKDFPAAEKALDQWISKSNPERLIPQDFLFRGQAKVQLGVTSTDPAKISAGLGDLRKAVEMDSTNADVADEIGKTLNTAKMYDLAAEAYDIATKNPVLGKKVLAFFWVGLSNYQHFTGKHSTLATAADTLAREQAKPYLVKGDAALAEAIKASPTTSDFYYYRALIAKEMDDLKNPTGSALPAWEKYLEVAGAPTDASKNKFIIANREMGTFYQKKLAAIVNDQAVSVDEKLALIEKGLPYFNKMLELDPANALAKSYIEYFTGAKNILTAAPKAGAQVTPGN